MKHWKLWIITAVIAAVTVPFSSAYAQGVWISEPNYEVDSKKSTETQQEERILIFAMTEHIIPPKDRGDLETIEWYTEINPYSIRRGITRCDVQTTSGKKYVLILQQAWPVSYNKDAIKVMFGEQATGLWYLAFNHQSVKKLSIKDRGYDWGDFGIFGESPKYRHFYEIRIVEESDLAYYRHTNRSAKEIPCQIELYETLREEMLQQQNQ